MNNKVPEERDRTFININDEAHTLTSKDIIRKINPVIIPRISSLSSMALCERAAYNISFFGMESNNYTADGVIGNAIHRIILRSMMEITQSLKGNSKILEYPNIAVKKTKAIDVFIRNAERDVKINWKHFMLSDVENPLPTILDDLETRSKRLVDQIFDKEKEYKKILLRPEFTIRNTKIPLEGRLDLIKIKIKEQESEKLDENHHKNKDSCSYLNANDIINLDKESVEIVQIKTGNYRQRSANWNLQADAETLLLIHAFNLKQPPTYTWQFSDKDAHRKKFNFTKVFEYIDKYIKIWK